MEQETLQTVKALCRNTQESMEKLEERKTQLKEELKVIYDLQKQEREVVSKCLNELYLSVTIENHSSHPSNHFHCQSTARD